MGKIYYDGTLKVDYNDITRDLSGSLYGWGARTGGVTNEHRVRNLMLRKFLASEPTVAAADEP